MDAGAAYYDGSSTESEPFGDEEEPHPLSTAPSASAPPLAPPASQAPTIEPSAPAPTTSYNVLDLFALVAPPPEPSPDPTLALPAVAHQPLPSVGAPPGSIAPPPVSITPPPPVSIAPPLPVSIAPPPVSIREHRAAPSTTTTREDAQAAAAVVTDAPPKCGKCGKLMLSEVASLTPRLVDVATVFCHCCGLTLPWFAFTEPQRAARWPECRGCRGVSSVVVALTERVRKLLPAWKPACPPPKVTKAARRRAEAAAAAGAAAAPAANAQPTSISNLEGVDPRWGRPPVERTRKQLPCRICGLTLVLVTDAQAGAPTSLRCNCCARPMPPAYFSKNQRSKGESRRCMGCLGNTKALARSIKQASAAADKATEAQAEHADERQEDEATELFRNKVTRHKFALRALSRKRRDNDLRGSTRVEYLAQLAKEQAALNQVSKMLQSMNPAVFAEVMGGKVRSGNYPRGTIGSTSKRRRRTDPSYSEEQEAATKLHKTNGLAVMTRAQRRAAGMAPLTDDVIDLTDDR